MYKQVLKILWSIVLIYTFFYTFAKVLLSWIITNFHISIDSLLFTVKSPKINANTSVIYQAIRQCLPKLMVIFIGLCIVVFIISKLEKNYNKMAIIFKFVFLIILSVNTFTTLRSFNQELDIQNYIYRRREKTTIYEDYYVSPNQVKINKTTEQTHNLIYIYLESMESTYDYVYTDDYIDLTPNLSKLAADNVSFSDSKEKGGFYSPTGTDWTMAGLMASTSGIPFSFPVEGNDMNLYQNFAPNLITLGDILEKEGYSQEFICGSDSEYGGRKTFFHSHGNFKIFDFFSAYPGGFEDYNIGWWGIEDSKLYDYAKKELLTLSKNDEPFNLTLLTVDTHFGDGVVDGYLCDRCKNTYNDRYANVISCADSQIMEFIEWIKQQDFYLNTTIVITGDHPFMGKDITNDNENKTVYNCFINPKQCYVNTKERQFTTFDIFPTTLASLGFSIEGDKLGLGTNLFSSKETLCETIGLENINKELSKYSQYYIDNFE